MDDKFKNKYRTQSFRLQSWDYGSSAAYFVTICTANREHFFGEIENNQMNLNLIGQAVKTEWLKTFKMRPDMNLQMGEFIIMPNHFHAIIIIGNNQYNTAIIDSSGDAMHCVPTKDKNKFGPQSKNLASIIRGFKSAVTTFARKNGNTNFGWQSLFHDVIIRDEKSFYNISNYIINNPKKWNEDTFKS